MPTLGWDRAYRSGDLVRNDPEGLVFIALAAHVLAHADPAMTARVYLGRKGSTSAAAEVL